MEVTQLRYFLAASKTLNYTKAAEQFFTSRQNLTHAIRGLETELGVKLFGRFGNSLVLTVDGEEAARQVQIIVEATDALQHTFGQAKDAADGLTILCGINVANCAPYDIPKLLSEYEPSPLRVLEYGCKTCYEKVLMKEADLAIVACMEREFPGCGSYLLAKSPILILTSEDSELATKDWITMSDLLNHKVLLLEEYEFQFGLFLEEYCLRSLKMSNVDTISNVGFMVQTVRQKDAVGIVSTRFIKNAPKGTVTRPFADSRMQMSLYVLYLEDEQWRPSVKSFLDYTKETFARTNPA